MPYPDVTPLMLRRRLAPAGDSPQAGEPSQHHGSSDDQHRVGRAGTEGWTARSTAGLFAGGVGERQHSPCGKDVNAVSNNIVAGQGSDTTTE